jgi:septal ring factor EnvC (AmiA/AmiB activator)
MVRTVRTVRGVRMVLVCLVSIVLSAGISAGTQTPNAKSQSDRAAARIRALQAEADRLATQARTVFGELRRLELDQEIKQQHVARIDSDLVRVTADRDRAEKRVTDLEAIRVAQTPGVAERLLELSKRGRAGYVQLLLAADDVRALGRMARGVAAVAELDRVRLETHRRTLAAERDALNDLDQQRDAVEQLKKDAVRARAAVDAAVAARNRMIMDLDERRDLAAQFVAELQQSQLELERTIDSTEAASSVVALPIRPFKGDLPWPIDGRVTAPFGKVPAGRFGTTIVRNGIEVAAKDGASATAVHEGTVAFAAPFSGFGTMVIVDHGDGAFTLYGHLLDAAVSAGTNVSRGAALGRIGLSPSGGAALYFELRIDGRPVNPVEWLARRTR